MACSKCRERAKALNDTKGVGMSLAQKRMQQCLMCDSLITTFGKKRCKECGCFLGLKTLMKWTKCPKGVW